METTFIQNLAILIIPLLFAITLHEVAHGFVAMLLGDQTARLSGRLSINPLKHIDLVGTVIVPLLMLFVGNFIFGWAKPVPVDPRNLKHPRRGMAIVSLAGPVSNILMAFFWGGMEKIGLLLSDSSTASVLQSSLAEYLFSMGMAGITINVVLAVLNLIPLPPLDGGKVLMGILPRRAAYYVSQLEPYGFFILILLLITGVLSIIMRPSIFALIHLIEKFYGLTA